MRDVPTDTSLTDLVADAKRMPASMLPRPHRDTRVIDLTQAEIRIPESTISLVDDLENCGV